jgi:hypothetical protein
VILLTPDKVTLRLGFGIAPQQTGNSFSQLSESHWICQVPIK